MKLKEHFASIVGSIIYLSITCRPDIACATSKLARGMHGASRFQVNLLKTTLQYLNDHRDTPLVFKANDSLAKQHFRDMTADDPTVFSVSASDGHTDKDGTDICVGFSDANYAYLCSEKKRSTSGYAFFVLENTVSWKSKLQPLTAGSTHEAELIALSYASDEGVWLGYCPSSLIFEDTCCIALNMCACARPASHACASERPHRLPRSIRTRSCRAGLARRRCSSRITGGHGGGTARRFLCSWTRPRGLWARSRGIRPTRRRRSPRAAPPPPPPPRSRGGHRRCA